MVFQGTVMVLLTINAVLLHNIAHNVGVGLMAIMQELHEKGNGNGRTETD